jgi:hypothetical protein
VYRRHLALLLALPVVACSTPRTLPPLPQSDEVLVQRNSTEPVPLELSRIAPLTVFVNQRLSGWAMPWYGAPVGQVYFIFRSRGRVVGNFYVGPWFFGRDHGDFLSQTATRAEVEELGRITSLPLLAYVESAARR